MCGINAIFDPAGKLPHKALLVGYMDDQMRYRGPDDQGIFVDEHIALGTRRLSIIDVDGGHQPVSNEDSSLVIVFNGEIYNYLELRRDLQSKGHHFASRSDTEVILHLYEEKGPACLADLRGMFAFVIWDARRQRLFAARDRVGIKPLYYSEHDGVLWLSSELKAIVGAARIGPTLRDAAVYQFLLYGFAIDQRHTVVEQIKRVLPGEYILAEPGGLTHKRYWAPSFATGGTDGTDGADGAGAVDRSDDELRTVLADAVSLHLRSDVPVGILLSGGVDSSGVAAFAARAGGNHTALCVGYAAACPHDERERAHATARSLGLPYTDVILDSATYGQQFDRLAQFCDEPLGDWASMPQWALYAQARQQGYKVLLSGIGGDEVFFGYPLWNDAAVRMNKVPGTARHTWTGFQEFSVFSEACSLVSSLADGRFPNLAAQLDQPLYELRESAPWGPDAMAAMLFGTYLVHNGCYLADRLAMGCSVEVRVPLLDHVLVDSVFSLPLERRFREGQSKILLKQLLKGMVPSVVLDSPKRGFTPPTPYLEQVVVSRSAEICDGVLATQWFAASKLRALVAQQSALPWLNRGRVRRWLGVARSSVFLFRILAFERWHGLIRSLPSTAIGQGNSDNVPSLP
jgi:asparagine synthase (glutamine-hydrolysing)